LNKDLNIMLVGKKIQKEKKETKQEGIKVKNTKKM
jgi:hypothetical protein